jgi:hypothetical protein
LQLSESCLNVLKRPPRIPERSLADGYRDVAAVMNCDSQLVRIAFGVELQAVPHSGVVVSAEAVPLRDGSYQVIPQLAYP